jgi:lipopolysaccharide/colanic/teichoic acid biosynthesis glycosyltransferase
MYRFRLGTDETDVETVNSQSREKNRLSPVGIFLHRTGLHELPLLFNVLHGDMTIVWNDLKRPYLGVRR